MVMPTIDMFNGTKPRRIKRVMAHMTDCGADAVLFECEKCGWSSGWIKHDGNDVECITPPLLFNKEDR